MGNWNVLAIADGHGTSQHADVGARLAVEVAVSQLLDFAREVDRGVAGDVRATQAFAEHPLRVQLVREWARRVREHGGAETELQPYGSTLLFALSTPGYLLVGQLGDGDILYIDPAHVTRPIEADPANFGDETASLCMSEAWASLRVRVLPRPVEEGLLLLSTDGYSKSYATDEVFEKIGPDYLAMFREDGAAKVELQLGEILDAVSVGGSGDDIALAAFYWPIPGADVQRQDRV